MTNADLIEQMKKESEIIEKIHAQFPNIEFPEPVLEPIYYGRLSKNIIEGRKLILDWNTKNVFDIVSDSYKLFRHEIALDNLLNSIPEEFGKPVITPMMIKSGAKAMFSAEFPEMPKQEIGNYKGEGALRISIKNSYDRSAFVSYSVAIKELVCSNGLVIFKNQSEGRSKHLDTSIIKFNLKNKILSSMESISETKEIWKQWMELKMPESSIMEVVSALPYSEAEQKRILTLPLLNHEGQSLATLGGEATLWTVNSAATQFVHEIASIERKIELEQKIPYIINKFNK